MVNAFYQIAGPDNYRDIWTEQFGIVEGSTFSYTSNTYGNWALAYKYQNMSYTGGNTGYVADGYYYTDTLTTIYNYTGASYISSGLCLNFNTDPNHSSATSSLNYAYLTITRIA
jgi:hypothetical protein